MKVSDIMTDLVVTVPPSASAEIARSLMKSAKIHHLPVMEGKKLVGVLSERDLGRPGEAADRDLTVGELMTTDCVYTDPQTPVRRAANLLRGHNIGSLPVLDGDRLVGIVTVSDLLELVGRSEMLGKTQHRASLRRHSRERHRGPIAGRL
jgi:acetoin utilization protein AcuB